jgi:hypothetical protein
LRHSLWLRLLLRHWCNGGGRRILTCRGSAGLHGCRLRMLRGWCGLWRCLRLNLYWSRLWCSCLLRHHLGCGLDLRYRLLRWNRLHLRLLGRRSGLRLRRRGLGLLHGRVVLLWRRFRHKFTYFLDGPSLANCTDCGAECGYRNRE